MFTKATKHFCTVIQQGEAVSLRLWTCASSQKVAGLDPVNATSDPSTYREVWRLVAGLAFQSPEKPHTGPFELE